MPTRPLFRERAIKDLLRKESIVPDVLLEFGYGSGEMLRNFSNWFPGAEIFGYDFSSHASEFVKSKGTHAIILTSEKEYRSRQYTVLCAFEVLEHIEDDVDALCHWSECLADSGYLLLSVPAHMSKWQINDEVSGHFRRYEKEELSQKLAQAGYKNIRIINYGYPMTIFLDVLLKIVAGIEAKTARNGIEEKTRVSGLSQTAGVKGQIFKLARKSRSLFYPLFALQRAFYNYDWSSGYVAIAQKS